MSEGLLIHRARMGNLYTWWALVQRHQAEAYRLAYAACGGGPAAERIALKAFLQAYNTLHLFDDNKSFRPWLLSQCWEVAECEA